MRFRCETWFPRHLRAASSGHDRPAPRFFRRSMCDIFPRRSKLQRWPGVSFRPAAFFGDQRSLHLSHRVQSDAAQPVCGDRMQSPLRAALRRAGQADSRHRRLFGRRRQNGGRILRARSMPPKARLRGGQRQGVVLSPKVHRTGRLLRVQKCLHPAHGHDDQSLHPRRQHHWPWRRRKLRGAKRLLQARLDLRSRCQSLPQGLQHGRWRHSLLGRQKMRPIAR
jgi:hypothetical protein